MDSAAFHAGVEDTAKPVSKPSDQGGCPHIAHTAQETPAAGNVAGTNQPRSSSGQDGGLSRRKPEFDSPSGHEKKCSVCAEAKPLDAFNRDRSRRDGRQRICRECYRTKIHRSPANQAKARERAREYTKANPEKRRAHRKLEWAIESGKMVRGFCEQCGTEKADAHHWRGYDHPLDVQWLCRSCHVNLEPRRGVAA